MKIEKIHQLHRLLKLNRRGISAKKAMKELKCSHATFHRIKNEMRLLFDAPISYSKMRGYYYDIGSDNEVFELPGMWVTQTEMAALATIQFWLSDMPAGVLKPLFTSIQIKAAKLLQPSGLDLNRRQQTG